MSWLLTYKLYKSLLPIKTTYNDINCLQVNKKICQYRLFFSCSNNGERRKNASQNIGYIIYKLGYPFYRFVNGT